jgi:hypothetical protein
MLEMQGGAPEWPSLDRLPIFKQKLLLWKSLEAS